MPNLSSWAVLTAGVVGLVSAASLLIVDYIMQEKRRKLLTQDYLNLHEEVSTMRAELENLRRLQMERAGKLQNGKSAIRNRRPRSASNSTAAESDAYLTAGGTDIDSDEYYDLSSAESDDNTINADDELNNTLAEIDRQLDGNEEEVRNTLTTLQVLSRQHPENVGVYWRFAKACHRLSEVIPEKEDKRKLVDEGINYCEDALNITTNVFAHKWYAILVGSRASLQTNTKDKINDGNLFKQHLDAALKIDPNDWTLHHLLGRFKYEIAGLSWLERTAASTFFAEPPQGTYEEAIDSLKKAESYTPKEWKENRLFLAKCYIALSDYPNALHWLDRAKAVSTSSSADKTSDMEIAALLKKYNSNRI